MAAYLASSRGITCNAQQVLITDGYQGALDLAAHLLLRRNDRTWIEDPCYLPVREILSAAGSVTVPIRVDGEGLRVADGLRQARRARLAVVTPSHQSPLGVALSLPRRLALLAWASAVGAFIIEDDYDSEFRYVGRPLPALKSLDQAERVLYAGSFSKVLFPALRLGYLVLPDALIPGFRTASRRRQAGHSVLEQRVVAKFMAEGHFARHLKRMRTLYAARREALANALHAVFRDRVEVDLQPGGMHLIVRFVDCDRDIRLAKRAQAKGLAAEPLSTRAVVHACPQGLLLGFANIPEAEVLRACRRLERAIGPD